jgi:hypothetical protein
VDIALLAQKNLNDLSGYTAIEQVDGKYLGDFQLNFQILNEDEEIIGFYRNQPPEHNVIAITSQRIAISDSEQYQRSIFYENIQAIHTEPSKNTNKIFVRQKDGSSDSILVNGIKGDKFLDVYGFSRFLKKVMININLNNTISLTV